MWSSQPGLRRRAGPAALAGTGPRRHPTGVRGLLDQGRDVCRRHHQAQLNKQAAIAAKDYLESTSFSRQGLIEQLEFEGYTRQQSGYGVSKTGL